MLHIDQFRKIQSSLISSTWFHWDENIPNPLCQLFSIIQHNTINYSLSLCRGTPTDIPPTVLCLCICYLIFLCPPEPLVSGFHCLFCQVRYLRFHTKLIVQIPLIFVKKASLANFFFWLEEIYRRTQLSSFKRRFDTIYIYIFTHLCKSRKYLLPKTRNLGYTRNCNKNLFLKKL